jgi:murein DD-endopeptidase MepM/ murein hydrolase activator NlpD
LSIEQAINGRQGALLATAHQVAFEGAVLVTALAQPSDRHEAAARLIADIQSALQLHQAVAAGFQTSLQNEYDFFVNAVQSPATVSQIRAAVAVSGGEVSRAVDYDIETVQTQVAQEAAIAAAVAAAQAAAAQEAALTGPVRFRAPVGGVVTQGFGPTEFGLEPPATYRGVFYPHFHTGLDIASSRGTQVGAAAAGVVMLTASSVDSSGHLVGYGNYVIVRHADGFLTLYGHLDQLLAYPGEVVKQGQVIGLLGSTGWSTGPHVHFEVRKGDTPIDPAAYITSDLRAQ